jgi:tRNA G46 methylase TrmB
MAHFNAQIHRALKLESPLTIVTDDRQYAEEVVQELKELTDLYALSIQKQYLLITDNLIFDSSISFSGTARHSETRHI